MAHNNNKQTELKSAENVNIEMRRSFSWDRAFFTSDGFLDAEELSSMIEGGGDDVKQQLQKIEEIESLEAKLFEEIEASTRTSTGTPNASSCSSIEVSSGKKDSQTKKERVTSSAPSSCSTPVKSPSSGGSRGKKVKSPARRSASFKTGKAEGDSHSKTSAGINKRNNGVVGSTRVSRTPPASPGSSGSTSSTFSVNQQAKRSSSVPRRSSVNSEKPSAVNARRNDEWKTTKNKVVRASSRVSRTPPASPGSSGSTESSSSTFSVKQRSKRSSSAPRRSSVHAEKPSSTNARRNDEWKTTKNKVSPVNVGISRTSPASPLSSGSSSSTFSDNQRSKRSSSVPCRSSVNSEKPSSTNARRNDELKTTKNKMMPASSRMSRTPPASPGSSSSTVSVNQRSKRSSSVPRRFSGNSEKPSSTNARRNDEWETCKPAVILIPKTQSSISLKIKPPPVASHPTSPSELFNSFSSSRAQPSESSSSSSSSSTYKVNQRSKPVGRSKSTLKHHPAGQTPDRNRKQAGASRPETRSLNASKTKKLLAPKTAAAGDTKTTTPKPSKKQSSTKSNASSSISRGAENIILVSPEVMDIKGKLNALKMEISIQKERQMQGNQNEP